MSGSAKIKVLVIDDSALIRNLLTEMINSDPGCEVVGVAQDPLMAREKIKKLNPDVLTLDVEMPKMDGLTFLSNLMRLRPMPVVMISSLTEKGADITLQALELGAIDFVAKPKVDVARSLEQYRLEILEKIHTAATVNVKARDARAAGSDVGEKLSADAILEKKPGLSKFRTTDTIIAIGASTGGTEAIKEVLMGMPADSPAIVVTQHIPEAFSGPFANRMNASCQMVVCEAEHGQQIVPGHVYIAPGSHHLIVARDGARYVCELNDGPPVNRHKPSVDVMFRSVAQNVGPNAIGAILTGMGDDGARGLKEMLSAGASTVAQDENTSVVWGMPGEAVKLNAAQAVLPLTKIAGKLCTLAASRNQAAKKIRHSA
ncbi:MAG TPA: chemotaxis response regulator protein-glutamate methylesterase [Gammaproteobacteria bacterium]|nr:chemotaxis response regulator protein-glutamate methylesterase [Gammaproteobacteria bacterium]